MSSLPQLLPTCLKAAFLSFLDPLARSQLTKALDKAVSLFRSRTFAESTTRTYRSQQLVYLQFCASLGIMPVPISQANLGRYIAFLASRLCFSSVRQYLNVVRLMHLEAGESNPLVNSWYLSSILKGLRRHKGDSTSQKLPITPDILLALLTILDFKKPFDLTFWAACLVGFFTFFRKSNLLIPAPDKFDPDKHLCTSDVIFQNTGAVLTVRWSKTIQFKQRVLLIPLPRIPGSPFCPSTAILLVLSRLPARTTPRPLFCFPLPLGPQPMTHPCFVSHLRISLSKLGFNASQYSGHSFRRGGASFALQCGIPTEWIKLQGDWTSDAYQRYLSPAFPLRVKLADLLGKHFPSATNMSK